LRRIEHGGDQDKRQRNGLDSSTETDQPPALGASD
jgi:hypothetical protein